MVGKDEVLLFTNFKQSKRGLRCLAIPVSKDNAVKCLREGFDRVCVPGAKFTLHSLKTVAV